MKPLQKPRIEVIDALRGFALLGIMLVHCLEHFDALRFAGEPGPVMQWLNTAAKDTVEFVFLGKSYAIFSMLFGLSFFIQMENQADRGIDFRWRFAWRLVILYFIGHINGLFYAGEILVVYAVFGFFLLLIYKVPDKWLLGICLFLIFLIPSVIHLIHLFIDPELAEVTPAIRKLSAGRYTAQRTILSESSFGGVISHNFWEGQVTKWLYYLQTVNVCRILGLFTAGLLIGRKGIHKDPEKMVKYAKRGLGWGTLLFTLFYSLQKMLPLFEIEGTWTLRTARQILMNYANQSMMFVIVGVFILSYFRLDAAKALNKLAPVGRISLTNYFMQSVIGAFVFYGFGLGLDIRCGHMASVLIGLGLCVVQVVFSQWWIKRYHYGPIEYLWRGATWMSFKNILFKKKIRD